MKTKLKWLCLVLSVLLLLPLAVACGDKPEEEKPKQPVEEDDGSEYDSNGYLKDSLPKTMDNGGKEVKILTWNEVGYWEYFPEEGESLAGTVVGKALKTRQETVNARFGVNLKVHEESGAYASRTAYQQLIANSVASGEGEGYDLIGAHASSTSAATLAGHFLNMTAEERKYLDFTKPWWSPDILESCSFDGKIYYVSGDITATAIRSMACMILNLDLYEDLGQEENIYEIVDKGEFTMEKLKSLGLGLVGDLVQDGYYGITCDSHVEFDNLFYSAGFKLMSRDADGDVCVSEDVASEKLSDWYTTCQDLIHKNEDAELGEMALCFCDGYSLWHMQYVSGVQENMKDVDFNFAICPYPKYDENQDRYYTVNGWWTSFYSIPSNAEDPDLSCLITEALASYGYRTVTHTVYADSFQYQTMNTEENAKVFDLLHDTLVFDIGRIFADQVRMAYSFRLAASSEDSWITIRDTNLTSWEKDTISIYKTIKRLKV